MKKRFTPKAVALVLTVLFILLGNVAPVAAQDSTVTIAISKRLVTWTSQVENGGMILTISGPDFYLRQEYAAGARPTFEPYDDLGKPLPDGVYTYELELLPLLQDTPPRLDQAERGLLPDSSADAIVLAGSFSILDGGFVTQDLIEDLLESGEKVTADVAAPADIVHNDDVIIIGSLCVGFDCVNGESFGFDTIRLKENNLRIKFQDTSSTASFPTNDWQITINDSANGGASYFGVDDISGGRSPFRIEAGAPSYALYVEDYGRVGLGTSTPVVEMHIKDSDTPTVRLEQDGSGGWTPQTWDVAGNESNFFIRDATNGSRLPFRIQPGAPSSSLSIKSDGRVGIGTWSPIHSLEVETTGSHATIAAERTDGATVKLVARDNMVTIGSGTNHKVLIIVNSAQVAEFGTNGDLTIAGTLHEGSDVNAKENFSTVNNQKILETLAQLPITSWNFKVDDSELRHIGPMSQDFYQAFGFGMDDKHIAPLDANGVALAATQGLYEIVQEKDVQISALQAQNVELEARLTALEQAGGAQPVLPTAVLWLLSGILLAVGFSVGRLLVNRIRSFVRA